jgi:hypothetical protein
VQIPKNAVYAAVFAFLVLFGAVLFLLGRESARRRSGPVVTAATATPPVDTAGSAPPGTPTMPPAQAPPMPTVSISAPPARVAAPQDGLPPPAAPPPMIALAPLNLPPAAPAGTDPRSAARDYFTRMQAIQSISPTSNTGELANQLLTSSMTGDSAGFDDLIKTLQAGTARVQAIAPPPCCVEYHQHLLSLLGESTETMKHLRTAISKGDSDALTALAASGGSLQTRATALEDEARRIKSNLGLPY